METDVLNILVADDDDDDRDFFKRALAEINEKTCLSFAKDGNELMYMLSRMDRFPDFLFLDIRMPVMDGLECLTEIRKKPLLKGLKIIMLSTSNNTKDIEEAFKEGANLYVIKPYSFNSLKESISKIINLKWNDYVPRPNRQDFLWGFKISKV